MADERWLVIAPRQVRVVAGETPDPTVVLMLDVSDPQLGLAPGLRIGLSMSPAEGRAIAHSILRKADEAEARLPRA